MRIASRQNTPFILNYGWKSPQSLIVLVPIVSVIARLMQTRLLYQKMNETQNSSTEALTNRLDRINEWHLCGSLVQAVALLVLHASATTGVFSLLALIPLCDALAATQGFVHGMTATSQGVKYY